MPCVVAEHACRAARGAGLELTYTVVQSLDELHSATAEPYDLLLCFGTGLIVPEELIQRARLAALNIHAGSPEYPGRDPHHFAAYHRAMKYGATLHYLSKNVDEGPIVAVDVTDINGAMSPYELLQLGNEAGHRLMRIFFSQFAVSGPPTPDSSLSWSRRKSTRQDFMNLCRVDCGMAEDEFNHRLQSTAMPGFNNIHLDLHGYRFRLEGKIP